MTLQRTPTSRLTNPDSYQPPTVPTVDSADTCQPKPSPPPYPGTTATYPINQPLGPFTIEDFPPLSSINQPTPMELESESSQPQPNLSSSKEPPPDQQPKEPMTRAFSPTSPLSPPFQKVQPKRKGRKTQTK
jgi:hypothetical protein